MSFDNSSSFVHWQSSLASGSEKSSQGRTNRPPTSVWGQSTSHAATRGGLTPLATSNINSNPGGGTRRAGASDSPGPQNPATSPVNSNFPSLSTSNRIGLTRQVTSASSSSPFPPLQAGGQQHRPFSPNQSVISPRSRTITPLSQLVGASANSYAQAGLGAGGGGGIGAGARSGTYSPSPTGGNITSPTNFGSERSVNPALSTTSNTSGQSSLSKISVAQVLLLVDTISEKEGKAKWDSKAEQIRKVCFVSLVAELKLTRQSLLTPTAWKCTLDSSDVWSPATHPSYFLGQKLTMLEATIYCKMRCRKCFGNPVRRQRLLKG